MRIFLLNRVGKEQIAASATDKESDVRIGNKKIRRVIFLFLCKFMDIIVYV